MMRAARTASLLVAFSLLTSAVTAYAECAWVLWRQTIAPIQLWEIVQAHPSVSECSSDLRDAAASLKVDGFYVAPLMSGARVVPIGKGDEKGYLRCLPDTVDPRGRGK